VNLWLRTKSNAYFTRVKISSQRRELLPSALQLQLHAKVIPTIKFSRKQIYSLFLIQRRFFIVRKCTWLPCPNPPELNGYNKSGSGFIFENHSAGYGFDNIIFWSLPGWVFFVVVELLYLLKSNVIINIDTH